MQSPYPIYRHGKACLSKHPPWRAAPDPRLARGRSRVRAPGPAGALRALFFLHPPFLPPSGDSSFRTSQQTNESVRVIIHTGWVYYNPNTIKSYKNYLLKHAAHGVAQSPYPIYRHEKACLSNQPPWRAAPDPRLARGRSWVRAPGRRASCARFFLHPPFLPPSGDSSFRTFPTKPTKVLGLKDTRQKYLWSGFKWLVVW